MKILHVFDHSIPLHSGYTFRSRQILLHQRALGWQTAHVTSSKQGSTTASLDEVDGLHFYRTADYHPWYERLPLLSPLSIIEGLSQRLDQVIALERPDMLHAHSPALNGMAALKAARRHRLPLVYEVRAFWEDAAVDHGTCRENDLRYKLTRAMETHVLRQADAVTCICDGLRQDISQRGIDAKKITLIPNAVDIGQFPVIDQRDQALADKLGFGSQQILGFIGSFYGYEGLDLLIAAMPAILARQPNTRLLLVGGGPQEQALKDQARQLGISDKVLFTGRVPHHQVNAYYSLIDILVFPRKSMRLTELVTPLKPLEAMAQGRLVLASNVGGHRELIEDGQTGWLFEPDNPAVLAEAALAMLADQSAWPRLRAAGRRYVETERNWARSVSNYQQVYPQLLAKR